MINMPKISKRGEEIPASPIRKLTPFSDSAKAEGVKVYHLNIGQPDLPTPQKALDSLKTITRTTLEYSPSQGLRSLRDKLVGYYSRFGINVTDNEIIVTTGGSEALLLTFLTCLNPGDEIIMTEPGYANYISFAVTAGITVKTVTSRIEEGFALPSVEDFEKAITEKTKAILIAIPTTPPATSIQRKNSTGSATSSETTTSIFSPTRFTVSSVTRTHLISQPSTLKASRRTSS